MLEDVIAAYHEAVLDTDRDRALAIASQAVAEGISPQDIIFKVVLPPIEAMMESAGHPLGVSLAQHFVASQIAGTVTEAMLAKFTMPPPCLGHVVIGTSQGDFHGLGKRIVTGCLRAQMIGVTDLGLNVAPEQFVDTAVAEEAEVIAISSMMVHTARGAGGCRGVRRLLQERALDSRIKIIVGGAPYRFDAGLYRVVEADAWAENALAAGKVISALIREVRK